MSASGKPAMTILPDTSDAELLQRYAQQADREALGELFRRHAAFAYRIAYLTLREPGASEDAVQEAFVRLLSHVSTYDPARPFRPWFKVVVARSALEQMRSRKRRDVHERRSPIVPRDAEDPAARTIGRETCDRLGVQVDRLPDDLRLPVVLHYQGGYSYAEIAQTLGCPQGTVATRLAAARERLKAGLATAGVLLVSGLSLEEALAASAPASLGVPAGLSASLKALASTPQPAAPVAAASALKPTAIAAAVLLAGAGVSAVLMSGTPPTIPYSPPYQPVQPPYPPPPAEGLPEEPSKPPETPEPRPGAPAVPSAPPASRDVSGVLLDALGQPLAGLRIWCWPARLDRGQAVKDLCAYSALTEPDGAFRFPALPAGDDLHLLCVKQGPAGYMKAPEAVAVGTTVALRLEEGRRVSGRVMGADGAPAAGAQVFAEIRVLESERPNVDALPEIVGRMVQADAEGHFVFTGLPEGQGRVFAFPADAKLLDDDHRAVREVEGGPPVEIPPAGWTRVPAGAEGLEIRLDAGGLKPFE